MKKLLVIIAMLFCVSTYAQVTGISPEVIKTSKDTTAKKDTIKYYYLVLPEKQWGELFNMLKSVDEKPSVINGTIQYILSNLKEYKILPEPKTNKK